MWRRHSFNLGRVCVGGGVHVEEEEGLGGERTVRMGNTVFMQGREQRISSPPVYR